MTSLPGCHICLAPCGDSLLFGFMSIFLPYSSTGELIYWWPGCTDLQRIHSGGHAARCFASITWRRRSRPRSALYLDIINLFLAILRILNSQSNN